MPIEFQNKTFSQVWQYADTMVSDYLYGDATGIIFPKNDEVTDAAIRNPIFPLLYYRFAARQIANSDENLFKSKVFSIIYIYGPEFLKELEIKKKLRGLSEDDILAGSKQVANVSTSPGQALTEPDEQLQGVDQQTRMKWTKSKMEGYANLLSLIDSTFIERFVSRFDKLFKKVTIGPKPPEEEASNG